MKRTKRETDKISVKKDIIIPGFFCFFSIMASLFITLYAENLKMVNINPLWVLVALNIVLSLVLIFLFVFWKKNKIRIRQYEEKERQYEEKEKRLLNLEDKCLNYEKILNDIKENMSTKNETWIIDEIAAVIDASSNEAEYCLENVTYDVLVDYDSDSEYSDIYCVWTIEGCKKVEDKKNSIYKIDLRGDSNVDDIGELGIEVELRINNHGLHRLTRKTYPYEKGFMVDSMGTSSHKKVLNINFGRPLKREDKFSLEIKYKWASTYLNSGDRFRINPGTLYNYECKNLNIIIRSKDKCFEYARLSSAIEGTIEDQYVNCDGSEYRVDFVNISGIEKKLYSVETYP